MSKPIPCKIKNFVRDQKFEENECILFSSILRTENPWGLFFLSISYIIFLILRIIIRQLS